MEPSLLAGAVSFYSSYFLLNIMLVRLQRTMVILQVVLPVLMRYQYGSRSSLPRSVCGSLLFP